MIIFFLLRIIVVFLATLFGLLPTVTVLPWGTDAFISSGIGYFNRIAMVFPPFHTLVAVVLLYLAFKLAMMFLKLILGSRVPTSIS